MCHKDVALFLHGVFQLKKARNANMAKRNFNKVQPETTAFGAAILEQKSAQKAQADKRNKYITTSKGNEYRIERWSHGDCFDRLPTVANLLYVPTAAVMAEEQLSTDIVDYSMMVRLLFQRIQEVEFTEWMKDLLDKTYKVGEGDKPVDLDESFETPLEVIEVVVEVLQANFMMDLCVAMQAVTPSLMQAGNLQENLTKASQETSKEQ